MASELCLSCNVPLTDDNALSLDGTSLHVCSVCYATMSPFERVMLKLVARDPDEQGICPLILLEDIRNSLARMEKRL